MAEISQQQNGRHEARPSIQTLYTRLTRSPPQIGTYKSLWLAEDHFMQVESSGYSESYQRFQFTDVQAFFIQPSNRRLYWNLFWSLCTIVVLLPFLFEVAKTGWPIVWLALLVVCIVFLFWNCLLGPTCRVYLVTKVQTVHLGGVARRRKANRVLGRIQPLIEEAQKSLVGPVAAPKAEVRPVVPAGDVAVESPAAVSPTPSVETPVTPPTDL
jgi:hypothetical protein